MIDSPMDMDISLTDKDMLVISEEVDAAIETSLDTGDPTVAIRLGQRLLKRGAVTGLAMAKLLHFLKTNWSRFSEIIDGEFRDVIYSEIGVSFETAQKYISVWENIFNNQDIPDQVKRQLTGKPMRSLILLSAAARDNNAELDWNKIVSSTTSHEVSTEVRRVRGDQTSSASRVNVYMDRQGALFATRNGETHHIGFLYVEKSETEIIGKAIERILKGAGILEMQ